LKEKNWLNIIFQCKMFYSQIFFCHFCEIKRILIIIYFYLANYEKRSWRNVSFQCMMCFFQFATFVNWKNKIVTIFVKFLTIVFYGKTHNIFGKTYFLKKYIVIADWKLIIFFHMVVKTLNPCYKWVHSLIFHQKFWLPFL
jgi:hypothetical protein